MYTESGRNSARACESVGEGVFVAVEDALASGSAAGKWEIVIEGGKMGGDRD